MPANRYPLVRQPDGSWALPPGFVPCAKCRLHVFSVRKEDLETAEIRGAFPYAGDMAVAAAVAPHYHCEEAHDA